MRKALQFAMLLTLCLPICRAQTTAPATPTAPVLRESFTLKLRVDKEHCYEENHDKGVPYVSENEVYLFLGDKFGVNITIRNDRIVDVSYQRDFAKADVWFMFQQPKELQKSTSAGMMLTIQNKMKRGLSMEALMTVPGKKEVLKTSILPIEAGLSNFESWPHPIAQLVLGNLQLRSDAGDQPKK
jgi:hypothetical protein